MRPDVAASDRMQTVREAARDWHRAGWIDENARRAVEQMYPDDRVRTGPAFRILFFVLTLGALLAAMGLVYANTRSWFVGAMFALNAGLLCAAATSYLLGPLRRRQGGIEAAFSVAAVLNLIVGLAVFTYESHLFYADRQAVTLLLFLFALLTAGAAWLWGYWPYAAISAAFLFLDIINLPAGRLLWILVILVLFKPLLSGCDSMRLPPSLRKSSAAFLAVALLALYAAVNVFSLDHKLTEFAPIFNGSYQQFFPRSLSIALTAALPLAVFMIGIAARRRLFLNLGFILILLSLATLREYVHVAPLWVVLTGAGLLLLAGTEALRRLLDSGSGGERAGFAAQPLTEDPGKRRALEILAGVATLTPGSQSAGENKQFQGGGGQFGGGGASGDF